MEYPKNHGSKWTKNQISECIQMFDSDCTLDNISNKMERTVTSIKALRSRYIKFINTTKDVSYEELSAKFGIDINKIKEICEMKSENKNTENNHTYNQTYNQPHNQTYNQPRQKLEFIEPNELIEEKVTNQIDKLNKLIEIYRFTKNEMKDDATANVLKKEITKEISIFVTNRSNQIDNKNKLKAIDTNSNDEINFNHINQNDSVRIKYKIVKNKNGEIIRKEKIN